ncbi:MAG: anti-sigma factor family protein [Steroidobacteraceae bacterium]
MDHLRFKSDQTAAAYVADELDPVRRQEFELHMMSCQECLEDVEGWRAIKNHLPQQEPVSAAAAPDTAPRARVLSQGQQMHQETLSPETFSHAREPGSGQPIGQDPLGHEAMPHGTVSPEEGPFGLPPRGLCVPDDVVPRERPRRARPSAVAAYEASLEAADSAVAPRVARKGAHAPPPAPHERKPAGWRLAATLAAVGLIGGVGAGWYGRSVQGPSVDANSIGFYSLPPLARGPADCTSVHLGPSVSLLALRVPGAVPNQQLVPVDSEGHDLRPESYSVRTQADGSWLVRLPVATVREQGIRFEARSADGTVEPRGCVVSATQQ